MSQSTSVPPPMAADATPSSESTGGAIGSQSDRFARADHRHPRITWSRNVMLDANGVGVADFSSKPFPSEPVAAFAQLPGAAGPCTFQVESWIMSGPNYVGANIRGWKSDGPTQTLASVTIVGISAAVGGQTVQKYGPAAGVKVSVVLLPDSGV